jgi:hypothetical protein
MMKCLRRPLERLFSKPLSADPPGSGILDLLIFGLLGRSLE